MILDNVGFLDLTQEVTINESNNNDELSPVYILLTTTGSIMSKTIRAFTGDDYTHVSLSFDAKMNNIFSFNFDGFVKESFDMFKKKFGNINIGVFCVLIPKINIEKIKQQIQYFIDHIKEYSYSILGLFGVLLNKPINRDDKMFCSQFVDSMLKLGGVNVNQKDSALVRPQEFATSNVVYKVYEGKINDYKESKVKSNIRKLKRNIMESYIELNTIQRQVYAEEWVEDHRVPKEHRQTKCDYKKLFFVSSTNMDGVILNPIVPDNFLTKNGYEDNTTCRVCCSTSINGCLTAMSMNLKGKTLCVHEIVMDNIKQVKPSVYQVPDCNITNEVWITNSVKLKYIGDIKVEDAHEEGMKYKYGPDNEYEAELYRWNWKWIKKINKDGTVLNEANIMEVREFFSPNLPDPNSAIRKALKSNKK